MFILIRYTCHIYFFVLIKNDYLDKGNNNEENMNNYSDR